MLKYLITLVFQTIRAKRVRFPKGKKEASGDLMPARKLTIVEGEEELNGTVLSTNPLLAAKERAMRRTALADQLISSEDTSIIDDVAAAEEEASSIFN
jgi:hypothetical protein